MQRPKIICVEAILRPMKIVVGMSGASGAIIGVRLLEQLKGEKTYLIISESAKLIIGRETQYSLKEVIALADENFSNGELDAEIASGTSNFDAMVIAPCSMNTLAKIACGISDNLITRTAAVALKERKKLIVVPRETPLSTIALRRMYELSSNGAVILPPVPAFYLNQKTVDDVVDYTVGKVLEHLGIEQHLYTPYRR